MKRFLSVLLCCMMLMTVSATTLSVFAAVDTPNSDVPQILIYTDSTPNRDAYVACTIKFVDKEGGTFGDFEDTGSSIKIRGNSTAIGEKKPYNIKFSAKTDVMGMGKAKKWSLLSNCYEKTLLRNKTVLDFADNTNLQYTSDSEYVDLYLNDKYLGSYQITESVEVGSTRVDIDTTANEFLVERDFRTDDELFRFTTSRYGIDFNINEPELADITTEQSNYLIKLFNDAETALASGNFTNISQYFDIDTMVDFYIVNEFFKTTDVHQSSTRVYVQDGIIHGGPLWDFDLASGNINPDFNNWYCNVTSTGNSWEGIYAGAYYTFGIWFNMLMNCKEFNALVVARYEELAPYFENLYEDNELGTNYIDRMLAEYGDHFNRNYSQAGWSITYPYSIAVDGSTPYERYGTEKTYAEHVAYYRYWLNQRHVWLCNYFGIEVDSEVVTPEVPEVEIPEGTENLVSGKAIYEYVGGTSWPTYYTDMTDGKITENFDVSDGDFRDEETLWFGFNANQLDASGAAYVIYDLGEECNINMARIHVALDKVSGNGINMPNYPQIQLSTNGKTYTAVYDIPQSDTTNASGTAWWALSDITETARYVKISLIPQHWAFVDEIEVYGTPVNGGSEDIEPEPEPEPDYGMVGDINGDGKIVAIDYFMLKQRIFDMLNTSSLPEGVDYRSDYNQDGKVNATDYLLLKKDIFAGKFN